MRSNSEPLDHNAICGVGEFLSGLEVLEEYHLNQYLPGEPYNSIIDHLMYVDLSLITM
jgi:hypothetical protein